MRRIFDKLFALLKRSVSSVVAWSVRLDALLRRAPSVLSVPKTPEEMMPATVAAHSPALLVCGGVTMGRYNCVRGHGFVALASINAHDVRCRDCRQPAVTDIPATGTYACTAVEPAARKFEGKVVFRHDCKEHGPVAFALHGSSVRCHCRATARIVVQPLPETLRALKGMG